MDLRESLPWPLLRHCPNLPKHLSAKQSRRDQQKQGTTDIHRFRDKRSVRHLLPIRWDHRRARNHWAECWILRAALPPGQLDNASQELRVGHSRKNMKRCALVMGFARTELTQPEYAQVAVPRFTQVTLRPTGRLDTKGNRDDTHLVPRYGLLAHASG